MIRNLSTCTSRSWSFHANTYTSQWRMESASNNKTRYTIFVHRGIKKGFQITFFWISHVSVDNEGHIWESIFSIAVRNPQKNLASVTWTSCVNLSPYKRYSGQLSVKALHSTEKTQNKGTRLASLCLLSVIQPLWTWIAWSMVLIDSATI